MGKKIQREAIETRRESDLNLTSWQGNTFSWRVILLPRRGSVSAGSLQVFGKSWLKNHLYGLYRWLIHIGIPGKFQATAFLASRERSFLILGTGAEDFSQRYETFLHYFAGVRKF